MSNTIVEVINENTIVEIIDEYIDIIEVGIQGPPGIPGPPGPPGSSDTDISMLSGGNTGEILSKNSDANYDFIWVENPYNTIINRYDSNNDGKIDHAEFADLAENSNFVDGKDINNYYTKGQVDLITRKYVYNQSTPSTYWVLNHYLNRYPNVVITDSAGSVLEGSIIHLNLNTTVIQFNMPISGKASLS
jgi:hypothetical protein